MLKPKTSKENIYTSAKEMTYLKTQNFHQVHDDRIIIRFYFDPGKTGGVITKVIRQPR